MNLQPVRIAYAQDTAFCACDTEKLALLASFGAELVAFSPLVAAALPAHCHALYLGDGLPDTFPIALAENQAMLSLVRDFCRAGAPVFAEGTGFLYLQLAGVLPGAFYNTGRFVHDEAVLLTAQEDTILCKKGAVFRAQVSHCFDTSDNGCACIAENSSGSHWECVKSCVPVNAFPQPACKKAKNMLPSIFAGFPRLDFSSNPDAALSFVNAARRFSAAGCGGGSCCRAGGCCASDGACGRSCCRG